MQTSRNLDLDKFKGVLIWLVVLGHTIEPMLGFDENLRSTYVFIYIFHIPAFAFLAGVAVKSTSVNDADVSKILINLIVPLFIMLCAYEVFHLILHRKLSSYGANFAPYWHLWFLFSLILWKLLLPFVVKFRYHIGLSFIIALLIGLSSKFDYFLSLSRTFYFLPFFLLGVTLSPALLAAQLKKIPNFLAISMIFLGLYLCLRFGGDVPINIAYGSSSFSKLNQTMFEGFVIRAALFIAALVIFMCFFRLVQLIPNFQTIVQIGRNSLVVFLFHGFVVKIMEPTIFVHMENFNFYILLLSSILISSLITVLLAQDIFKEKFFKSFVKPTSKFLIPKLNSEGK